jgi:hypothetical protein
VARRYGGSDYDRSGTGKVCRVMTLEDADAEGAQIGCATRIHVTPTHGNPSAASDEGERTHARSTDSYEVNGALIRGVEQVHV